MKTIVISDTHLDSHFEEKKFNLLKEIISHADRIILNGDFWDGYFLNFQEFLDSKWKVLFPLLKKKKTVYLYGNHDKDEMMDRKLIKKFCDFSGKRFEIKIGKKTFVFEHGNRLMPFRDELTGQALIHTKFIKLADNIEKLLIKSFGANYQKLFRHLNKGIKIQLPKELRNDQIYVCGHTHCAEVDEKNQFINTGMFKHGLGQFLVINDYGFTSKEIFYG